MRRRVSWRAIGIALLLLLVFVAGVTEAEVAERASDSGLHGNVRSVEVTTTSYSWQDAQWRAGSPWTQKQEEFDHDGRLLSRTNYRSNGRREQISEYEYHDTGVVRSVSTRRYDYDGDLTNRQLTEYRADGVVTSDVLTTGDDQVLSRRTLIDLDNGYRIELHTFNSSGQTTSREETQFDGDGRVTEEMRRYTAYASRSFRRYSYDDDGRLHTVTHDMGGIRQGSWEYSYDADGRLNEIVHRGPSGSRWSTRTYRYDDVGRLRGERVEHVDLDGLEDLWTYAFDQRGNVIRQTYSQAYTDFEVETTNEHDDGNRVIGTRVSDTFGRPAVVTQHTYDETGQATMMQRDEIGLITGFSAEFTYDSEGRLILNTRYDHSGAWQSGVRHGFDSHGNRTEESMLNADGSYQTQTTYDYEYDNRGNWTRFTRLVSTNVSEDYGRIHQVTVRQITYYD